ncbi:MAG: nicotinate (nicotinamide) nucleotide adenylyltransferase [Gammaproteobacteria bacterium RIFCSPLOWO2_02_FULL_61_13]|nr:MAG: nicotinate (nicotinamide) nucleotide adenylyltransferase [Gammaproteobacteria bacterium RIFCSPLOWO2_02_FULL_61_13]
MTRVIGLLGGTFDPIHHGHLRLALECAAMAGLTQTHLIPAHLPPLRAAPVASAAQRLRMVELATAGDDSLRADTVEVARGGTSYTVDTLMALRSAAPTDSLCLILGQDAFLKLRAWRRWEQILELAHLVIAARPGQDDADMDPALRQLQERHGVTDAAALQRHAVGGILSITIPALDISATRIRLSIAAGRSVRFLTPEPVIQFIQQEALYRNPA